MKNKQTVSREEYSSLDNQITCILQQCWPADEICQWVEMLKVKQQSVACAIQPHPTSLALPAVSDKCKPPDSADYSSDGRQIGKKHSIDGLTPVTIDHRATICCTTTSRPPQFCTRLSDLTRQPGTAEQLNSTYKKAIHQCVADHRLISAGRQSLVICGTTPLW